MKRNNKKSKKVWGAIALGMLLLSGGVFAFPTSDVNSFTHSENFKTIRDNPKDFLKSNKLELRKNFDYFEDINKEFSEKPNKKNFVKNKFEKRFNDSINIVTEKELLKSIEKEDYTKWKKALTKFEGYPEGVGVVSEDDFKILIKVHKNRKDL